MTSRDDSGSRPVSRRNAMKAAASLLGLSGTFLATGSVAEAQDNKTSQQVAQYQDRPKAGHHCSICAHFQPPHSCRLVAGTISPDGWCKLYSPKNPEG